MIKGKEGDPGSLTLWSSLQCDTGRPSRMPASRIPYAPTATEVLDLLNNITITVEEYARSLLDRIKERDGIVKAWAPG